MDETTREIHFRSFRNPITNLPSCRVIRSVPFVCAAVIGTVVKTPVAYLVFCNRSQSWLPPCQSAREAIDVLLSA